MFTCYFLLVAMVLLVVTPKLGVTLSMYVVYSWLLVVGCLLNIQEVKYDFGIWSVACLLTTCYKHACLLAVSWMSMWLLEICLLCTYLVG